MGIHQGTNGCQESAEEGIQWWHESGDFHPRPQQFFSLLEMVLLFCHVVFFMFLCETHFKTSNMQEIVPNVVCCTILSFALITKACWFCISFTSSDIQEPDFPHHQHVHTILAMPYNHPALSTNLYSFKA